MVFRRAVNKRSFWVAPEVPLGFGKHKFEDSEAGGRGRVPAAGCLRPRCRPPFPPPLPQHRQQTDSQPTDGQPVC